MTIKKAVKILEWFIEKQNQYSESMIDPKQAWNQDFDVLRDMTKSFSDRQKDEIKVLEIIKTELVPKCKHPKKMQDIDSNGNRYCMDCNWDL